ncbi:hypothetical protein HAL013_06910 [Helicobacter ailurogastricus]|uniref:Uncharacterized protein n=1 Tax=Helicobacter ailurogastricus TaxID=1578720 RepID=A0A0K2XAB8_9HELI|nr:hypothetical protein HAL011_07120 [Helicobacter ailurogastricus]CRF42503.1 hypothetical protein HAL013_06910 [Helicobacter ailurogastricus]
MSAYLSCQHCIPPCLSQTFSPRTKLLAQNINPPLFTKKNG